MASPWSQKIPFETTDIRTFCDKIDSRHISVAFGEKAQLAKPLVLHNFYVPAGGDIPDPALNPKFDHKLKFLDEMKSCEPLHPRGDDRHILVGDLNVAPHEHDVWSHKQLLKVVSHTPIETREAAGGANPWRVVRRRARAHSALGKSLYVVELPRRRLDRRRSRPEARSHLGLARTQGRRQRFQDHARCARLGTAVRSCAGNGDAGSVSSVIPALSGTTEFTYLTSRPPSGCRWRAGWCGSLVRRGDAAQPQGRFPARAETGCARS